MKPLHAAWGASALLLVGCHAVFGIDEFSGASDDIANDAGDVPRPQDDDAADPDDDTVHAVDDTDDTADDDALDPDDDRANGGAPGEDDAGGLGGAGASGGGSGGAPPGGSNSGGAPFDAGPSAGGVAPDVEAGVGGGPLDACAACPVEAPFCLDGRCVECEPATRDCSEGAPRVCSPDGTFTELGPCPTGVCADGACVPPSCAGLPKTCGPLGDQDCCSSLEVPGGTFLRQRGAAAAVTLSDFRLDEFEITVGRFRKFLEARDSWSPSPEAGAYPRSPESGWDPSWPLESASEIAQGLLDCGMSPYTEAPGDDEDVPIACLTWYEAFAFCAWDGGHLPTDAQWSYAALGGAEHRYYPWSVPATSTALEANQANYNCTQESVSADCLREVGSFPAGRGSFGHQDLAGNVLEWVMDDYASSTYFDCGPYQVNCLSKTGSDRGLRGGSYRGRIENSYIFGELPDKRLTYFFGDAPGARCARGAQEGPLESCTPGDRDCDDAISRICDESGQWVELEVCEDGCQAGSCNACGGTERGCVDNAPAACSDGAWVPEAQCSGAAPLCRDGECVAVCSALGGCGPDGAEDCCEALPVPGGAFDRLNDEGLPASVSPFVLERFEVTVGRFREFVDAYPGSRPAPGDGAHPLAPESGWDAAWDALLPATREELVSELTSCARNTTRELSSYTRDAAEDEDRAMNCVTWYEAFAYCTWIGGRLPTFAEFNFAHVGGSEQRVYPWSSPPDAELLDLTRANHAELTCPSQTIDATPCVARVGSSPDGAGAFGQEDLAGNLAEFTMDASTWPPPTPCADCVQLDPEASGRRTTGGSWLNDGNELRGDYVYGASPDTNRAIGLGFRCVVP